MERAYFILLMTLISFSVNAAQFVGGKECIECHQQEDSEWQASQHAQAMTHATDETVLADFAQASFIFEGKENRFFRKGKEFWVNIEGADAKFHDYQVKYTFGVYPLQQYMVEFEDGRVQLIPFTWDSRDQTEGGQRWYFLYPQFTNSSDENFWLNAGQNWNFMCADCHSTNLQKGYDKEKDVYKTTWSEINVSCEACHGPASEHIKWLDDKVEDNNKGFDRTLQKTVKSWASDGGPTVTAHEIQSSQQVVACAQCHSRNIQLNESNEDIKNNEYLDRKQLTLIKKELYHSDGQIYDEDYVYGSFLQSKMSQAGVVCSNCHNPHSGKIKMPEPELCLQCHSPLTFAPEVHSHHESGTKGSVCSDCHMAEEKYMQIDLRKDHSWQIPRPDLSEKVGVPNACTGCHQDKNDQWANKQLTQWFPDSKIQNSEHFSQAFYAADNLQKGAEFLLQSIITNEDQSPIIRASALERFVQFPSKVAYETSLTSLKNSSSLIRFGAIEAMAPYSFEQQWYALSPMLNDPVLSVRMAATLLLAPHWQVMTKQQQHLLKPSLDEYLETQNYNSDRGGRTNIANIYHYQGALAKAEKEYLGAIKVEPVYMLSYLNLADLYRSQNRNDKAISILKQGLSNVETSAAIHYSLGLAYIRVKKMEQAKVHLLQATLLDKNNASYHYLYALAIESEDIKKAEQALSKAYEVSQDAQYLYQKCDFLIRHQQPSAQDCIDKLQGLVPATAVNALKRKLR